MLERLYKAGLQTDIKKSEFSINCTKYLGFIISTRDIIFNKKIFFNGKRIDIIEDLYAKLDTLIEKI